MNERCISILLHNIRSVHNVGAIFRTADAIGVSHIYLSGYTPTPIDRFGRPRKDFIKCSLGAEKNVLWQSVPDSVDILRKLKKEGFEIIVVEQGEKALDYKTIRPTKKTVVVFGNEVEGVDVSICKEADYLAEVPMRGKKESLNVSVAAGITLFRFFDTN